MIPPLREEFNRNFTPEKYRQLLQNLDRACGTHVGFRVSETPCFVPKALLDLCDTYVRIPMLGRKHSLNVATAGGVVLYELLRKYLRMLDNRRITP